jgi:hypothetical protein
MAHIGSSGPARIETLAFELANGSYDSSPVLIRNEAIAGFILVRPEEDCGAVAAQWVDADLRRTSAVAALVAEACLEARARGVSRFRFEYGDSVQQTARLAERLGARVIGTLQPVVRLISTPAAAAAAVIRDGVTSAGFL